jgi:hypothetical protein
MDRSIRLGRRHAVAAFAVLIATAPLAAQSLDAGAASLALAGAVTARDDARFVAWNAAAADDRRTIRASATTTLDGVPGIVDAVTAYCDRIDSLTAICATLAGIAYASYHEIAFGIGARRRLSDDLVAGASLRVATQSIDHYGSDAALMLDAGMIARIAPRVAIGATARNVAGGRLRDRSSATVIAVGALVPLADSIDLSVDLIHESGRSITTAAGLSIRMAPDVTVRAGASLAVPTLACGIGLDDRRHQIDASLAWVESVGARCSLSVGMRW